jgi:hypothetical protein
MLRLEHGLLRIHTENLPSLINTDAVYHIEHITVYKEQL